MWSEILNQSRSQRKFDNKRVIIMGSRHSGKRSLIDSLFDISKTTLHRRPTAPSDNRMRMHGTTTAIDYAYLNVVDMHDPDNRTHAKLEVYMVEDVENPRIYSQLADPKQLEQSTFVVMLDFTSPWHFITELEKWIKFIYELQQMAGLPIGTLESMAEKLTTYYKKFSEPEFDQNGKLKIKLGVETEEEELERLSIPLPQGVLTNNIRVPLVVCVNKCDLQSQVLREESTSKIFLILYHLRSLCVKYGASLIYTSIRNNSNLSVLYEYLLHRAYQFPLRFKTETVNEEAVFIPFGYDNPTLIADSVVKIDVSKAYNQVVPVPVTKKVAREEILIEEDSKFFEKYINQSQGTAPSTNSQPSEREAEKQPYQRKQEEVTDFFKNLLTGGAGTNRRETVGRTAEQSQRLLNAEKELMRHTTQVMEKKNQDQE